MSVVCCDSAELYPSAFFNCLLNITIAIWTIACAWQSHSLSAKLSKMAQVEPQDANSSQSWQKISFNCMQLFTKHWKKIDISLLKILPQPASIFHRPPHRPHFVDGSTTLLKWKINLTWALKSFLLLLSCLFHFIKLILIHLTLLLAVLYFRPEKREKLFSCTPSIVVVPPPQHSTAENFSGLH